MPACQFCRQQHRARTSCLANATCTKVHYGDAGSAPNLVPNPAWSICADQHRVPACTGHNPNPKPNLRPARTLLSPSSSCCSSMSHPAVSISSSTGSSAALGVAPVTPAKVCPATDRCAASRPPYSSCSRTGLCRPLTRPAAQPESLRWQGGSHSTPAAVAQQASCTATAPAPTLLGMLCASILHCSVQAAWHTPRRRGAYKPATTPGLCSAGDTAAQDSPAQRSAASPGRTTP